MSASVFELRILLHEEKILYQFSSYSNQFLVVCYNETKARIRNLGIFWKNDKKMLESKNYNWNPAAVDLAEGEGGFLRVKNVYMFFI